MGLCRSAGGLFGRETLGVEIDRRPRERRVVRRRAALALVQPGGRQRLGAHTQTWLAIVPEVTDQLAENHRIRRTRFRLTVACGRRAAITRGLLVSATSERLSSSP
jgi:hypothetical protein